jgi:hypothetical protein
MNIESEILRLYPNTKKLSIGGKECLYFQVSTPAHTFNIFNFPMGTVLAQIKVRNTFSTALLESLSLSIPSSLESLPANTLTVTPVKDFVPYPFEAIGIAPPAIAESFKEESETLSRITYWVFPLIKGEFIGGESASEFHFDNGYRGRGIHVIDWSRSGN